MCLSMKLHVSELVAALFLHYYIFYAYLADTPEGCKVEWKDPCNHI